LSARSDEAELLVAVGTGVVGDVNAGAAIEVVAVAAVAGAVVVGLAFGVSVGVCPNKVPASAIEQIKRRNSLFMGSDYGMH
jgi:hypothetical protein